MIPQSINEKIEDEYPGSIDTTGGVYVDDNLCYFKRKAAEFGYRLAQEETEEKDRVIKELVEGANELLQLHMAEQEGLLSGQPTANQWFMAVDKLSNILSSIKQ